MYFRSMITFQRISREEIIVGVEICVEIDYNIDVEMWCKIVI
jgi:hypothetical protein